MTWALVGVAVIALAIACETAHVVSPIMLAWTHPGLRQIALSRPIETALLPVAGIAGAVVLPFWLVQGVYWGWNAYHQGAQNYGVLRIFGFSVSKLLMVELTVVIMALGGGPFWPSLLQFEAWTWVTLVLFGFNHWLADIGLSSRVSPHWWLFLVGVLAIGCVGFAWQIPRADYIEAVKTPWIELIVRARWGIGIAHFLYSRWVWKLSDPRVRATIGKQLALA